jgi:ferric-dicitrate binding protein FerR (iron transport regulator)
MKDEQDRTGPEDADIAALLKASGPRPRLAEHEAAGLRRAVRAQWRVTVEERSARRRKAFLALAAGVAVAAVGIGLLRPVQAPGGLSVASLTRTTGQVEYREPDGTWTPAIAGTILKANSELRSGKDGRSALELENGVQLRLDSDTRLAFSDARSAVLSQGSVYVDTGAAPGSQGRQFVIETAHGTVSHLGTQYLAQVDGGSLRVAVREGRVSIKSPRGSFTGLAGEQLRLSPQGLERASIEPYAREWRWVGQVVPPYEIEGRSVEEFLAWTARESGHGLRFASGEARDLARSTMLRGSIEGLEPERALEAVLATTNLQPHIDNGIIHVHVAE